MPGTFEACGVAGQWIERLAALHITEPTKIQEEAIPALLSGRDVLAGSQTGTGKTLAYTLPILGRVDPSVRKVQALILVPTRELGAQIAQVLDQLASGTEVRTVSLIGGAAINRQVDRLKLHPHVAVGTPGRVVELIKMGKLSMHFVRTIVIDEADQVFELGSAQDVDQIIRGALRDRQLAFFSATIPEGLARLSDRWMKEPVRLQVQPEHRTAQTLEHLAVIVEEREKIDMLRRLIRGLEPKSAIVFTNEVDRFGEVLAKLKYAGLSIEGIYSEAGKQERAKVMKDFREGRLQLLLATDVAARGLDIPDVTHVFHFDLPLDADHYVHRSGRTGRMGREGTVIALCGYRQQFILEKFERALGITIERRELYRGELIEPRGQGVPRRSAGAAAGEAAQQAPRRSAGAAASDAAQQAPRRSAGAAGEAAQQAPARKSNAKQRDQKNKGAPKWLKEKQQSGESASLGGKPNGRKPQL